MAEDIAVTPAPAEGANAAADEAATPPNPISTGENDAGTIAADKAAADKIAAEKAEADKATEPVKKKTVRESVEAAAKAVEEKDKASGDDKAVETKDDKAQPAAKDRDATGKFTSNKADEPDKVAASSDPAPERFIPEAKAKWNETPEPVRKEVGRTIKNLEAGLQEHQKRWEPLKEFDDLAKKSGTTIDRALKEYVGIDRLLGQDFVAGMQRIAANKGIDLRSFAADVLNLDAPSRQALKIGGQPQQANLKSPEVMALEREIAQLKEQVGGVTGTIQQQQQRAVETEIAEFAKDKPLFDELATEIASYISNDGMHYKDAYAKAVEVFEERAKRAGFITQPKAETIPLRTQPSNGNKSIKGAPGPGSSPATRKPSSSIKEAIARAAAQVG